MSRLKEYYNSKIVPILMEEFGIKNKMGVPKLVKINVNVGIGDLTKNKEGKEKLEQDFNNICGQKLSERRAKISVASFSVRQGMVVGLGATLRKNRMYDFFDKFVNIVLPRLRDFRGVKVSGFDNYGNYTIGLTDHTVFPEIDTSKSAPAHGFEITFVTNAKDQEKGKRLLELLGMPFKKKDK